MAIYNCSTRIEITGCVATIELIKRNVLEVVTNTCLYIDFFSGTVDAHQQLDCEVVFHPSYLAPDEGKFSLKVSVLVWSM